MGIKYPKKNFLSLMGAKTRSEHLSREKDPSMGEVNHILNFAHYFDKFKPKKGTVNGPELKNSKVYLSVYHFLEYEGKDPHKYNTENIGLDFYTNITQDTIPCFYENYNRKIDKYEYNVLKKNFSIFNKHPK